MLTQNELKLFVITVLASRIRRVVRNNETENGSAVTPASWLLSGQANVRHQKHLHGTHSECVELVRLVSPTELLMNQEHAHTRAQPSAWSLKPSRPCNYADRKKQGAGAQKRVLQTNKRAYTHTHTHPLMPASPHVSHIHRHTPRFKRSENHSETLGEKDLPGNWLEMAKNGWKDPGKVITREPNVRCLYG